MVKKSLNFTRTAPTQGYIVDVGVGEDFSFSDLVDYTGYYSAVYGPWEYQINTYQGDKASAALLIPAPLYLLDENKTNDALIDFYKEVGSIVALFEGSPQFTPDILPPEDGYTNSFWYNLPTLGELRFNISEKEFEKFSISGALEISALTTDLAGQGYRTREYEGEPFGPTIYFNRTNFGLSAYWTDDTVPDGTFPDGSPRERNYIELDAHFVVMIEDSLFTSGDDVVNFITEHDPSLLPSNNNALGGNDHVTLTNSDDVFFGGDGNDTIIGMGGADKIYGGKDDDTIYAFDQAAPWVSDGKVDEINGGPGNNTIYATFEDRVIIDYPSSIAEVILSSDPTAPIAIVKDSLGNDVDHVYGDPLFVFNNGRSYRTEEFTNKAASRERLDSLSAQIDRHRDAADAWLELAKEAGSTRLDAYEQLAVQELVSGGQIALGVLEAFTPYLGKRVELVF